MIQAFGAWIDDFRELVGHAMKRWSGSTIVHSFLAVGCILVLTSLVWAQDTPGSVPSLDVFRQQYAALADPAGTPEAARLFRALRLAARTAEDARDYTLACDLYREAFDIATNSLSPTDMDIALSGLQNAAAQEAGDRTSSNGSELLSSAPNRITAEDIESFLRDSGDITTARRCVQRMDNITVPRLRGLASESLVDLNGQDTWAVIRWLDEIITDMPASDAAPLLARELRRYCLAYLQGIDETHPNYPTAEAITINAFQDVSSQTPPPAPDGALPTGPWIDLLEMDLCQTPDAGPWREDGFMLRSQPDGQTGGMFPLGFSSASYELHLTAARLSTNGTMVVLFPMGEQLGRAVLGGTSGGDHFNGIRRPTILQTNRTISLTIRVFPDSGGVWRSQLLADGEILIESPPDANTPTLITDALAAVATGRISVLAPSGDWELLSADMLIHEGVVVPDDSDDAPVRPSAPRHRTMDLQANRSWQWAMEVEPGQVLDISAAGAWSPEPGLVVGPEGDDFGWYGLRGRLVESERTFTIGQRALIVVTRPDILRLEMDDPNKRDNEGTMTVTIMPYSLGTITEEDE
jgi:hypothetical protein